MDTMPTTCEKRQPPKRIYLQNWDSPGYEGATWCIDKIFSENDECPDAEYVLVDTKGADDDSY